MAEYTIKLDLSDLFDKLDDTNKQGQNEVMNYVNDVMLEGV